MIIKRIQIENYLCYYDVNTFQFDNGLNIILGENNEGKTKFFEAIEWLFDGAGKKESELISAKKVSEIGIGDKFKVSVSMVINQNDTEFKIIRSFEVKKDKDLEISNITFKGEENDSITGERNTTDAQKLLNRIFPSQIRKYSMFKGETELNIFDNHEALTDLINLFSDARHYEKYSSNIEYLKKQAENAVESSTKLSKKNQNSYNLLEDEILIFQKEKGEIITDLEGVEIEKANLEKNIKETEKYIQNAEEFEIINKRIDNIKSKISSHDRLIDFNFTTALFDENWILVNFEPFHKKFADKVAKHSKERRELQSKFDMQRGIKEGEKKAKLELLNKALPLPIGTPSKAHMEEMLNEKICKVCNRPVDPDGNEDEANAYNYMKTRLEDYLRSQTFEEKTPDSDNSLFKFDYTNRLVNLSISHEDNLKNLRIIKNDIIDKFKLIDERKKEKENFVTQLEEEITNRDSILGRARDSRISDESKLINIFKDYTRWQDDLKSVNENYYTLNTKYQEIQNKIAFKNGEKDKIDLTSASAFLIKTRDVLRHIEQIFQETKEMKFNEFIGKLEEMSNVYLKKINDGTFTGQIKFSKRKIGLNKIKIEVSLLESGGRPFEPGTAVRTSMNMSILLAISELANQVRAETYPMIFDAPTSSFGRTKTGNFLNMIYETSNQKIILLKDFVNERNDGSKELYILDEFEAVKRNKAFWVKLERPFDIHDLSTMNTEINTL